MKAIKKYQILAICILVFLAIYFGVTIFDGFRLDSINLNLDLIKDYLNLNSGYAMLIFVALWVLRLALFIPGVTLMLLGGMSFGPLDGFLLSMLGMVISESLIYAVAKIFTNSRLNKYLDNKHPEISELVEQYNLKFLGLGILCPIAPTDAICFLSASTGINYMKFLLIVIIANVPVILSINYIGIGFKNSIYTATMATLTISLITYYTVRIWNRIKNRVNLVE